MWATVQLNTLKQTMRQSTETTAEPVQVPPRIVATVTPEFIRLPKVGQHCPFTGLTRSGMNSLILPSPANHDSPPVRSFTLRRRGSRTGVRLIDYKSLVDYIRQHPQEGC